MSNKGRKYTINAKGLIESIRDRLGVEPDAKLAKEIGVSTSSVANYRRANGIKSKRGRPARRAIVRQPVQAKAKRAAPASGPIRGKRGKKSKIAQHHAIVGTVPDRVVAEKAGVTVGAVQQYRNKHGISASSKRGRPAGSRTLRTPSSTRGLVAAPPRMPSRPRVAAPRKSAASGKSLVWQVLGVAKPTFIVSPTLAEAAERAQAAGHTDGLQRVGVALV